MSSPDYSFLPRLTTRVEPLLREVDWSTHPLGPPSAWPSALRVALGLITSSPESMYLVWRETDTFFFNDAYIPILGPRLPHAMGATFHDLWADAMPFVEPIMDKAMAGLPSRHENLRISMARYGVPEETWWTFSFSPFLDEQGRIVALFCITNETTEKVISDRKREEVETELRRLNRSLEVQVVESMAERDRLWTTSEDLLAIATFDGRLVRISPSWTRLFGHDEATLLRHSYRDFVHPEDRERVVAQIASMRLSGSTVRFENRFGSADGSYRWISWLLVPEPTAGSDRINAVGRDVTAERQASEARQMLEEQLRQSQKMEAVGQLTGGLAHDFNNLLTGIAGNLELLQRRIADGRTQDIDRYVKAAQGASKRAAALTHRLLAFSRRQTLEPKPCDVNRLVDDMAELVRRTVGPSIELRVVAATGLWNTLIDLSQLENALLNLCINARDAMPDGGRLVIETVNLRLDDAAAARLDVPAGAYVSLSVSDTGTGMTPEVISRAFDPFFTTKPIGMGTGLGLSMIYGFARQSNGQVRIESEVGHGSKVSLYLPRHAGSVESPDEAVGAAPDLRAHANETVLVVDDEPTIRMLIAEVLEDLGYVALQASDGASGLKLLQAVKRIDLLVTDVGLPNGINGRQLADAARSRRPDLKVLFITGYAENAVLEVGDFEPGMHVLTKPFTMDTLTQRISELLGD